MILFESICCLKDDFGLIEKKLVSLASISKSGCPFTEKPYTRSLTQSIFSESLGEIEAMVWPFK